MLQALIAAFAWVFGFTLPAVVSEEIVWTAAGGAVHSHHVGGLETMATVSDENGGYIIVSFGGTKDVVATATGGSSMVGISVLPRIGGGGGDTQDPVTTIVTSWTSAGNVSHQVITPIFSTTPGAIRRAEEAHDALVASRQAKYPPIGWMFPMRRFDDWVDMRAPLQLAA